ncbi:MULTISPECIES: acyl-CoA dehydrogenase family protein [Thermomonospora]|uniref:Acyl-CoA dehydrogenase domain protein n=1 Tax=Thermomonospora curvata (strain ATCC 19995 / DSM 43183 / JCM 3096 / KCTC 9072 / NBRC 15933 / NCIMB 10081 / Henssen B9) TaxID=471852 RepID=D1AB76_THECD|nr:MULTISPECIES: acyl-CoA dehydrogenase [Thermomonospora]6WY8_A Chain A, Acyl-CoA dehydrogenase domain protein Tcur3481 [Thermomonospora curvata DSM 43183]6WY8_C Chain C, Acyl-CoA dehydrogenase domain protein Tcur3481 [Thermomonospora curvata DSM 43183]6WY9_B Chain B, Acyl-CoA dehydrogenase domain protein Tcur3481 [Thermomonospora curvata DSM 43183]ACY99019.1 acyl-CoA dehydrogenase domain protein [Thermomonospora curvata DSM 43183]PKK13206.1 MAG: acyl-CoA dehydrogenase [Thermomonospora sp. CIF
MDFTLGEELTELQGLARQIFTDHATHQRLRAVETSESRIDETLWRELAGAGLLGVALPEAAGGAGLGLGALCVLLEEQGRHVAPVPLWPTLVAALAIAEHGTAEQRDLLPGVVDGSRRLTVALEEFGVGDVAAPGCTAVPDGDGWRLSGTKAVVPSITGAAHLLVSATGPDGPGLFLVDADAPGLSWERTETTSRDMAGNLTLDAVPARALGPAALPWTLDVARTALAAVQLGVASGALHITASYLKEREQFGRPLGTFQAVQHQLADCYIEIEAMRVCLWQAVCAAEDGATDGKAALVAKWWADEGGLNVVHRTQHLHGGIGVDVDYPIHRYFLWGKQISGTLGGASADLQRLGDLIAEGAAS